MFAEKIVFVVLCNLILSSCEDNVRRNTEDDLVVSETECEEGYHRIQTDRGPACYQLRSNLNPFNTSKYICAALPHGLLFMPKTPELFQMLVDDMELQRQQDASDIQLEAWIGLQSNRWEDGTAFSDQTDWSRWHRSHVFEKRQANYWAYVKRDQTDKTYYWYSTASRFRRNTACEYIPAGWVMCSAHCSTTGVCIQGVCPDDCTEGYMPPLCERPCPDGWFGVNCSKFNDSAEGSSPISPESESGSESDGDSCLFCDVIPCEICSTHPWLYALPPGLALLLFMVLVMVFLKRKKKVESTDGTKPAIEKETGNELPSNGEEVDVSELISAHGSDKTLGSSVDQVESSLYEAPSNLEYDQESSVDMSSEVIDFDDAPGADRVFY